MLRFIPFIRHTTNMQTVLGIETSCDDTGVAIFCAKRGILACLKQSQIDTHTPYGGVVPELASRDHIKFTMPLIQATLAKAGVSLKDIDGVAYTAGPGLIGALFVGAAIGRSLGYALNIPTVGVHHMEGHLLAPMLEANKPAYPFLALLVSGGHTQLMHVEDFARYEILGQTLDDAAGEAFDKTAKLLELGYLGGPAIAALAQSGDSTRFPLPRPMLDRPGLDFSFSGLKTAVLRAFNESDKSEQSKADIAASFQEAVVDTLVRKCKRAIKQTHATRLVIAGGVSANQLLRERLNELRDTEVFYPRMAYCTDNGAMIAYAGYLHLVQGKADDLTIRAKARWPLTEKY